MYVKLKTALFMKLREKPSTDPTTKKIEPPISRSVLLRVLEETDQDGGWYKVRLLLAATSPSGWVAKEKTVEVPAPADNDNDEYAFIVSCAVAARVVNERFGTRSDGTPETYGASRDYLLAWAWVESRHENDGDQLGPGPTGPFQLTEARWAEFLAAYPLKLYVPDHRFFPHQQCVGAAYLSFADAKAIGEAMTPAGEVSQYVPDSIVLYLANHVGPKIAVEILKKSDDEAGKNEDFFTALKTAGATEQAIKPLQDRLDVAANPTPSIEQAFGKIEATFDEAYKKVYELVKELAPEEIEFTALGSDAWLDVARSELAVGVKEGTEFNDRIRNYFAATDMGVPAKVVPWCGAFVAHCLKESKNTEIAKSIVKGSAAAASWKQWGGTDINQASDNIPVGAVVVLRPVEPKDSTGHVGFYLEKDATHVTLLGGNQSDSVCKKKFRLGKIVRIRWLGAALPAIGGDQPTIARFAELLTMVSKHEGGTNYDAHFGAIANKDPAFTTMSINEVIQWQRKFVKTHKVESAAVGRYQIIRTTLEGLVDALGLNGTEKLDAGMQDRMALQLMGDSLSRFLAKKMDVADFGNRLAMIWASLPVLKQTTRKKRTINRGQSFYAGVGSNKALMPPEEVEEVLKKVS